MSQTKWRESSGSISVSCQGCGKEVRTFPSRANRKKFCTHRCYADWLSREKRGEKAPRYGKRHTPETLAKIKATKAANPRRGSAVAQWKGGRHLMRGYVMVMLDTLSPEDRALAESMVAKGHQYVLEHRLVMARVVGRPLLRAEKVHHLNGVKSDNRPENLTLSDNAAHKMEHQAIVRELKALRALNEVLWRWLCVFAERTSLPAG